jgi:hypothetical protein
MASGEDDDPVIEEVGAEPNGNPLLNRLNGMD